MFSTLYVAFVGRRGTWAHWPSKARTLNSLDLLAGVVLEHSQCQNMVCFQHFILFLLAGVVLEHTDPPKRKPLNLLIYILSMFFIDFHAKDILHGHTEGYIMNTRIRSWECLLWSKHSQLIIHTCTPKFVRCLVSLCHHASTYHLKSLLMWSSFGSVWTGSNIPRIFTYLHIHILTSTSYT